MRVIVVAHSERWKCEFDALQAELAKCLEPLRTSIEHIGSTAVPGLHAKPIIDILVGISPGEKLEKVIRPMLEHNYVYYKYLNATMPYRRFFVKHKAGLRAQSTKPVITHASEAPRSTLEHSSRLAHIHVMSIGSTHWMRHIAFREYLKNHPQIRREYQTLKRKLVPKNWTDGNHYNLAKSKFIKRVEKKALAWYLNR